MMNNELSPIKKKKTRKLGSRRPRGADPYHKSNMPEARCAYFHRTKEEWRARYVEDTKRKMKCFSLKRYKNEHALTLAECFLSEMQRTHKVPHDNDINMWYDYLLRLGNSPNLELKSYNADENPNLKNIQNDPSDVIGSLIREQKEHTWIAGGSIPYVPPIGPWGESQLSREGKKKNTPQINSTLELYNSQTSNPHKQPLRYPHDDPVIKQSHETNLRFSTRTQPNLLEPFENSPNTTNSYQHLTVSRAPDTHREVGVISSRLYSNTFEAPNLSNMRYHKKGILRQAVRNDMPMEPNLEMMNKNQSPLQPDKSKPQRQISKPGPSNGIRLPRSPSLPPERQEFEEAQNIDFLLSHFTENFQESTDISDKKHRYCSLPSLISRCAKSRRKFWDMRYSEDVNYKDTNFERLIAPSLLKSIDNNNNLEDKIISIAKSFDILEPPQHLLSLESKHTKPEPESHLDIKHPYSSILSLEPTSLQAPIINFELLSNQNSYTNLLKNYKKETNGNFIGPTDSLTKLSHNLSDRQINLTNSLTDLQSNKNLKDNPMLKSDSILNLKVNYPSASKTVLGQADITQDLLEKGDHSHITSDPDVENKQNSSTFKVEFTHEAQANNLEGFSASMKACTELHQSGLPDLTSPLKPNMSEKEIETLLITQLSRPDFPTLDIDLESILNLSQMEEHNALTTGKLKYLRTLDEQLGRTLIEEENLHIALHFYLKLKNMKLNEIQLFEKTLARNCNIPFGNNELKTASIFDSDTKSSEEPEEMNDDHLNTLPTNDLEELLNLESLHIFSEALMDEKQRILDTLFYHMNLQLEKLNQCFPHILDSHLSKILRGDCYFPQKEITGIKEDNSIDQPIIKGSHRT